MHLLALRSLTHAVCRVIGVCVCMFWVPTTNTIALFIYFQSERCNPYKVSTHVVVRVSSFLSVIMRVCTNSHFYHFEELWKCAWVCFVEMNKRKKEQIRFWRCKFQSKNRHKWREVDLRCPLRRRIESSIDCSYGFPLCHFK